MFGRCADTGVRTVPKLTVRKRSYRRKDQDSFGGVGAPLGQWVDLERQPSSHFRREKGSFPDHRHQPDNVYGAPECLYELGVCVVFSKRFAPGV